MLLISFVKPSEIARANKMQAESNLENVQASVATMKNFSEYTLSIESRRDFNQVKSIWAD